MKHLKFLSDYIRRANELKSEQLDNANKVLQGIVELFDSLGITKLGLWNGEIIDYNDGAEPLYNDEDTALFAWLYPQFDYTLDYGKANSENYLGIVVAIEISEQKVYFFIGDTWNDVSYRVPAIDVFENPREENADFDEVIAALYDSIQFNIDNKIPVEKWCLTHYNCVNPYTYEYTQVSSSWDDDE